MWFFRDITLQHWFFELKTNNRVGSAKWEGKVEQLFFRRSTRIKSRAWKGGRKWWKKKKRKEKFVPPERCIASLCRAMRRERIRPYRRFQFHVKLLGAARQVQGEHSRASPPSDEGSVCASRTRSCMMHMDRARRKSMRRKSYRVRWNNFIVATLQRAMYLLPPAKLISMQSTIRIGYIDVNFFNKQSVTGDRRRFHLCV